MVSAAQAKANQDKAEAAFRAAVGEETFEFQRISGQINTIRFTGSPSQKATIPSRFVLLAKVAATGKVNFKQLQIKIKEAVDFFQKGIPFPVPDPIVSTKLTESMKDEVQTSTELSPLVKAQMVKSMTLPAVEIISIRGVN